MLAFLKTSFLVFWGFSFFLFYRRKFPLMANPQLYSQGASGPVLHPTLHPCGRSIQLHLVFRWEGDHLKCQPMASFCPEKSSSVHVLCYIFWRYGSDKNRFSFYWFYWLGMWLRHPSALDHKPFGNPICRFLLCHINNFMPVDAPILSLSINMAEEGEHPVYVDILLVPESECPKLPLAPTFREVSALLTAFSKKIYTHRFSFPCNTIGSN